MKNLVIFILTLQTSQVISTEQVARVWGTLIPDKTCEDHDHMVWISSASNHFSGRQLYYHAHVPKGGSFEFHLNPGVYEISSTSENSCIDEKKIELKVGEAKNIVLNPQNALAKNGSKK
jgi:hypothetical protein